MTAAELLRGLAREPVTPADADTIDRLLPLLAGLVEACGAYIDAEGDRTFAAMIDALDALNAAAAKEV